MRRDPYRVLEVSPGASAEELHDAYRRLVKLHHPDHGGSVEAFERITDAYHKLKDPESRRTHDERLARIRDDQDDIVEALREMLEADGRGPSPMSGRCSGKRETSTPGVPDAGGDSQDVTAIVLGVVLGLVLGIGGCAQYGATHEPGSNFSTMASLGIGLGPLLVCVLIGVVIQVVLNHRTPRR